MFDVKREVIVQKLKISKNVFPARESQFIDGALGRTPAEFSPIDLGHAAECAVVRATAAVHHQVWKQGSVDAFPRSICRIRQIVEIEDELGFVHTPCGVVVVNQSGDLLNVLPLNQVRYGALSL